MELRENHDAHYDIQHSTMEYLKDRNNCTFPAEEQQENVPVSILHQADEVRLRRQVKKQDKALQSIRSK